MYVLIFLARYCYYNICIIRPVKTIDYRNFKMSTIIHNYKWKFFEGRIRNATLFLYTTNEDKIKRRSHEIIKIKRLINIFKLNSCCYYWSCN